jgi:hypothetical protein
MSSPFYGRPAERKPFSTFPIVGNQLRSGGAIGGSGGGGSDRVLLQEATVMSGGLLSTNERRALMAHATAVVQNEDAHRSHTSFNEYNDCIVMEYRATPSTQAWCLEQARVWNNSNEYTKRLEDAEVRNVRVVHTVISAADAGRSMLQYKLTIGSAAYSTPRWLALLAVVCLLVFVVVHVVAWDQWTFL